MLLAPNENVTVFNPPGSWISRRGRAARTPLPDKHPGLLWDGPSPFSPERMLGSAAPSQLSQHNGESIFCGIDGSGEGRGEGPGCRGGVPLQGRRTMCEKPGLWVSHTDHRVPPAPPWERQPCSDQPTADPALIGFFSPFIVLSRDENPFVA